MAAPFG